MKRTKFFSLLAAALAVGAVACNNDGNGSANNDSTSTTGTETGSTGTEGTSGTSGTSTATSTTDYTALADTFRTNSEAGNYLDPRTGKSIKIGVDPQTGARYNTATNEPVWRYVDRRTWWVYGGDNWDTVGIARQQGNKLTYRGDNDSWVDYDKRWKSDDERMTSDWKKKYGDTKIKISKDGDVKVKDESGKVKYDADDDKIKVDSSR